MCLQLSHFLSLLARNFEDRWFLRCVLFLSFLVQAGQCFCCYSALRHFVGFYESHWDLLLGQTHTYRYLLDKLYAS